MSQVRNLRAMFEQKAPDTSPPERGRSPAMSTGGTESPRPLSRVQTSFVAIEKDGRIGLQREVSGESSVSRRRTSIDTEAESTVTSQDKPSVATEEPAKPFKTNVATETIPESPLRDSPVNGAPPKKLQPAVVAPPLAPPEKPAEAVRATPQPKAAEATQSKAAEAKQASVSTNLETKPKVNGTSGTVKAAQTEPAKEPATAAPKKTISQKPSKVGLSISSTASKPTAKSPSVKTPTLKTPTSPLKASQKLPTKTPEKSATPVASRTPRQPVSTTKSAPSSTQKVKPAPVQISPAHDRGIGFVKPKPKSPTRPVRLPASLMAQTASSGSKLKDSSRESLSRMSGSVSTVQSLGRSPSRGGDLSTGGQTLKRQKSTISRPRPSIGPPPKKPAQDHPVTKREREVDEGFLARMMRPTQSSSCKTAEKPPVTPPRKVVQAKKSVAKDSEGGAKKEAAAKAAAGVATKQVAPMNGTSSAKPAEQQSGHQEEETAERQATPIPDEKAESELKETIKTPEKTEQKAPESLVTPVKDLSHLPEKELTTVDNTTADDMKDFSSTADTVTEAEATDVADKEDAKPKEVEVLTA